MEILNDSNMWLLYLGLFIGPFVQEDTAVVTAASFSVSNSDHWISIFSVVLAGLILSDSWKYWPGWAAKHHKWAKKYADNDKILSLKEAVLDHSVKSLIAVRFLPLARIPTYLATGFFGVPYLKYWLSIAFSGLLYVTIIFTTFHILGEIIGEKLKTYMPLVSLGLLATAIIIFLITRHHRRSSRSED